MSNIYFMCENCGIETNGIIFVNGMKFCAKCYHQIFEKDNQQIEITQLKQQLAEKQNTIDEINKEFVQAVHDWKALCAKKDEEIEDMDKDLVFNANEIKRLIQEKKQLKQNQKQLAIQELEKVKDTLKHFCDIHSDEYYGVKAQVKGIEQDVCESIDYQIRELKGEK